MIDMKELDEMEKQLALYKFRLAMQEAERIILHGLFLVDGSGKCIW